MSICKPAGKERKDLVGGGALGCPEKKEAIWVKPKVVVEIAMNESTPDNRLRMRNSGGYIQIGLRKVFHLSRSDFGALRAGLKTISAKSPVDSIQLCRTLFDEENILYICINPSVGGL